MVETRITEEQSTLNDSVTVIRKADTNEIGAPIFKKKRVAAYCRVSTDLEVQESSLELQMDSFKRIIEKHHDWELAGIYADEGLTGTLSESRIEFQRMMEAARQKKIDMILVKSVSRFARNTADSLKYTRELTAIGVGVYFEKEGIDTSAFASEFLLTIFAAFAQEESHSISENIKRGLRNRYRMGEVPWYTVYGYRKGWIIEESEAKVIRHIFESYANGDSADRIVEDLNAKGIASPRNGTAWSKNVVLEILKNEKYVGDALLQKTYVADFMNHTRKTNVDAKIDKYYKRDNHEPIVDRDTYNAVQRIQAMQASWKGAVIFPYYDFLRCPCCGKPMVKVWIAGTVRQSAWTCGGEGPEELLAKRTICPTYLLQERVMERTLKKAILDLDKAEERNQKFYKEILDAQIEMKDRDSTSFPILKNLVDSISLEDWEHLVISWKMGWTQSYPLDFTKAAEAVMPDIQIRKRNRGEMSLIAGFPLYNKKAFLDGFRARQENALRTRVIDPDDALTGAPIVLRG